MCVDQPPRSLGSTHIAIDASRERVLAYKELSETINPVGHHDGRRCRDRTSHIDCVLIRIGDTKGVVGLRYRYTGGTRRSRSRSRADATGFGLVIPFYLHDLFVPLSHLHFIIAFARFRLAHSGEDRTAHRVSSVA